VTRRAACSKFPFHRHALPIAAAIAWASTFAACASNGPTEQPDGARDSGRDSPPGPDGGVPSTPTDGSAGGADAGDASGGAMDGGAEAGADRDSAAPPEDGSTPVPCSTRITYGSTWIRGAEHPSDYDDASGQVSWDGSCAVDGAGNAVATLSNGWKPVFQGKSCIIALDYSGDCSEVPASCQTRISYGPSWQTTGANSKYYDDVSGTVTWSGICAAAGSNSSAQLSNGWVPHFNGQNACDLSFRHTQCGGLFNNPVTNDDCPDPGVSYWDGTYYMTCTPGPKYRIFASTDLVHWEWVGRIFTDEAQPSWGAGNYWAPEIHRVGDRFIAYFSALKKTDGDQPYAVGAAVSDSPTGPFTDIGKPLVEEPYPGVIDAHYFRASSGKHYLMWKPDGNRAGQASPIRIQELGADGISMVGSPKTILINDPDSWEGGVVEGAWMVERNGQFYLFYSGNGYASPAYGVGVAKSDSPMGTFVKKGDPILRSGGNWAGPGHGSILQGPSGDWVHVYHSWVAGQVNDPPGRIVLVDRVQWGAEWPEMRGSPSSRSQPMP
jgi:arabinan endo-1,5-alpha-L-arabinosidase